MHPTSLVSIGLIIINIVVSYKGFTNSSFFDGYCFNVDGILKNKDYIRLVSPGFLHLNWQHLIFNMLTLYLFSDVLALYMGVFPFLIIYFAALIGGNLLALFIHRHHGDYTAAGASGAVCGIVFASIAIFPGMRINPLFIPLGIPAWVYGLAYILYTLYGVRSKKDNIGHEAHLGGAIVGMLVAIMFHPEAIATNLVAILAVLVPAGIFMYFIITRPQTLLVDNFFYNNHHTGLTIDDKYNISKADKQREVDRILEKIHNRGLNSLSRSEREKLDEYSKTR